MEIASQQGQENIELPHSTPPKAQGSIFRGLSKRLLRNGPRQVLHQGSPLVTQEIVKNEEVQPPVAASGTSSSPSTSGQVLRQSPLVAQEIMKNQKAQPPVATSSTSSSPSTSGRVLRQSPLVTQEIVKNEKAQPPVAASRTSSSPSTSGQVFCQSPLVTQEIVKNEKAQPPVAASGTSSSSSTSVHKVDGVTSQHSRRRPSCSSENPPVSKPSLRDLPSDTFDVSMASIFSDGGVDLLLEPSKNVIGEGNGSATLYSMLSVVRMYAPSRGPPKIRPRRRKVDPFKILVYPDDMARTDGVALG
jgi:hypothetical protein